MKKNKCAIIVTTIFDNGWLERICKEIINSKEIEYTSIIYIPDHKTPKSIFPKIKKFKKKGINILYLSIEDQHAFERKLKIKNFIKYNSDHRRNVGFILAYQNDFDFIISMDDDNFPILKNFVQEHRKRLGHQKNKKILNSKTGLFNNCTLLGKNNFIHPRGFPLNKRNIDYKNIYGYKKNNSLQIACNVGMWTIAPDVDAISWLVKKEKIDVKKCDEIIISKKTYCPINTQNTSIKKEFLPAYYYIKMGFDIGGGLKFDRLGDIFSGYFLQKAIKTKNKFISFGNPLVSHERHSHNYRDDANKEWGALRTIDEFFDWLINLKLNDGSVFDIYQNIAEELNNFAHKTNFPYQTNLTKKFYIKMSKDMTRWIKLLKKL